MKVCSKCNGQVADELSFCPNCGNKLDEGVQANPGISPVTETPAVAPMDTPAQQPSQVQTAPVGQQAGNKGGKTAIIIVLVVVVVLLIALCLVFGLKALKSNSGDTSNAGGNDVENVESTTADAKNEVSYNGFKFTVPDGYTTEEDSDYGLKFLSDNLVFSVLVDSTNSFNDYYNEFAAAYPTQADKLIQEFDGRKYVLIILTDETTGQSILQYVYESNEGYLFVGILGNATLSYPTDAEFNVLHGVLTGSKRNSTFAPGDSNDDGKDGVIKLHYDKEKFKSE